MAPDFTHFAMWKNGIYIRSTAENFPKLLKEYESRYGPAWIKKIRPGTISATQNAALV